MKRRLLLLALLNLMFLSGVVAPVFSATYMQVDFKSGLGFRFNTEEIIRVDLEKDSLGKQMVEIIREDSSKVVYHAENVEQISYQEMPDSVTSGKEVTAIVQGYECVDLGGWCPYWATYDVGALRTDQIGGYYAWGETLPKENYEWENYRWYGITEISIPEVNYTAEYKVNKYVNIVSYEHSDMKTVLEEGDDAATVNWGSAWHTPSVTQIQELMSVCVWSYEKNYKGSGVSGFLGTSKENGNVIFFPFGSSPNVISPAYEGHGYGVYWSNELTRNDEKAQFFSVYEIDEKAGREYGELERCIGLRIRPICSKP